MRITNNMVTEGILGELQGLETQQSTLQTQVSSGLAVTQPSDNPSAFGQVIQLQSENSQLTQYSANATQALAVANASYAGLSSMTQIYDRASQLGTLGSGTLGITADQANATELDQLIQQTVEVANTQLNGNYIYAGTAVNQPPFVATTDPVTGLITSVAYVGDNNQTSIALSQNSSLAPGTSGATNAGMATFLNNLIGLRDALQSGSSTGAAAANSTLASSEDLLTTAVADNGAVQSRIQAEQTQQQASATELGTLMSNATGTDLPTTIVKLNQAQLAYQAALQSATSVMHISILNYINLS